MSAPQQLPFAMQRVVCFALLLGMVTFTIAVAVFLQSNDGVGLLSPPMQELHVPVVVTGIATALVALLLRAMLGKRVAAASEQQRSAARFVATLVPLALIEGACLFAQVVWLLNGAPVPNLVTVLGLLSVAISIVPMQDPDRQRAE